MIKIIIFEDDQELRQSLKILLNGVESYMVIGDYGDCLDAKNIIHKLNPDLVIMDIDLPGRSGIEGVRIIKEAAPMIPVIIHTVFENDQKIFDSLCAGASGYLLKNSSFTKLLSAIDEVMQGGAPMSAIVARRVLESFHQTQPNKYQLSAREKEILGWMVEGYSNKMIAAECFISFETVRVHIRNIYTKLHVNCGREAVAKALKERIV